MTDVEKRTAYLNCRQFFNGHYPVRMGDQLANLAVLVEPSEISDFYGAGDLISNFEAEVASLLGKPAAVFMPSGTMVQVIALRIWCDQKQNSRIALHPTSHLERYEQHAYRELHGLKAELLGNKTEVLSQDDFEKSSGQFAAAVVELPQREIGGILPPWSDLVGMSQYCRSRGIVIHLDGARLWESAPFYQKSYQEICDQFDSVYVSFYKGLGGLAGAMLCGPADLIAQAKIWQRRHGGNLIRLYPYIISARDGMRRRLPKMGLYHEKAKEIAKILLEVDGLEIVPARPDTNMMQIFFHRDQEKLEAAFAEIALSKRVGLFYKVQRTDEDSRCRAELSVGDATLDLETTQIKVLFEELLVRSK